MLASLVLAGTIATFRSVETVRHLIDLDEAAWIFDSRFFDLYVTGDWSNPAWREFEQYAAHPPFTKYVLGVALHSVGIPMRSMEPRRYWYEHDLNVVFDGQGFVRDLTRRLRYRQVIACRYLSAGFALAGSVVVMVLLWRLFGARAGALGFGLLVSQSLYLEHCGLATTDSLQVLSSLVCVEFGVECVRAVDRRSRSAIAWTVALTIAMGFWLATKIIAFAFPLLLAAMAVILTSDRRAAVRSLGAVALASALGFGIACVLDPAIQAHPMAYTLQRFRERSEQIEIQQIVFVSQRLVTVRQRLGFAIGYLFFSSWRAIVLGASVLVGIVAALGPAPSVSVRRARLFVLLLSVFAFSQLVVGLPLTWTRYVANNLALIVPLGTLGLETTWNTVRAWPGMATKTRRLHFLAALAVCLVTALGVRSFSDPRMVSPPPPTADELRRSRLLAISLLHPGRDPAVHRVLLEYFERTGRGTRAAWERRHLSASLR